MSRPLQCYARTTLPLGCCSPALLSTVHLLYHETASGGLVVGGRGLEQPAKNPVNPQDSGSGGAISGAVSPNSGPAGPDSAPLDLPPDVAELARRLAALPEAVRAELVAMAKAANKMQRTKDD